jgi:hypothetical protein
VILRAVDLGTRVPELLGRHPLVSGVRLVGSRAGGEPTPLSDWDFAVETDDFDGLATELPRLAEELGAMAHGWDPLSQNETTYMAMLPGPTKVDFIFNRPREPDPPWEVTGETLRAIDYHFWDWILWLAAKRARGKEELVAGQLEKMQEHLLGPLGAGPAAPASIQVAVERYLVARARQERRLDLTVSRRLQHEVLPVLGRQASDPPGENA